MDHIDEDLEFIPPHIHESARITSLNLLPETSRQKYERAYDQFLDWRRLNKINSSFSETVLLAYMNDISQKFKSSTLWTQYSLLRTTTSITHNVDISKLKAFIQRKDERYQPKKAKVLTNTEINEFLKTAPDDKFLFHKVALILSISGACRKAELLQITTEDIEDLNTAAVIQIRDTKNKTSRSFTITGNFYNIFKTYYNLRPKDTPKKRFFL